MSLEINNRIIQQTALNCQRYGYLRLKLHKRNINRRIKKQPNFQERMYFTVVLTVLMRYKLHNRRTFFSFTIDVTTHINSSMPRTFIPCIRFNVFT